MRRHRLQKHVKYSTIRPFGLENVSRPVSENCGVLIAANHSAHWDSEAIYCALDKIDQPTFILTAWQVFGGCSPVGQWLLQGMGAFSIDREGSDRSAFREAVRILRHEKHPLLIFPEGDIYHTNDRITSFRGGMASIAMSAARSNERPVVIVPCAVKMWFIDDPRPSLKRVLTRLEQRLILRPAHKMPLLARINKLSVAALSLKEIEYRGHLTDGSLYCRSSRLMNFILDNLESVYGNPHAADATLQRVKNLRQSVIKRLEDELARGDLANEQLVNACRLHMEDLFTVTQLFSYPQDYLEGGPSIERIAETVDKLEEDIDYAVLPTIHGRKRIDISFGDPIPVVATRDRDAMTELAVVTRNCVQSQIDALTR